MCAQYAVKFLSPASASVAVWILAQCVRIASTVRKFAYYTLGVLLALVPLVFIVMGMLYLSNSNITNASLVSYCVAMYGAYAIYLVWMFED